MELENRKIAFLGDSITEGHGVQDPADTYWNLVGRETGALCYGYGIGGTRIALQRNPSENPKHDRYFASRINEMIVDAEIVVVFGGTNDYGHGDAPFGCFTDRTEETFCGAFHCLMEKLINRYPHAQLVVMTPLHRLSEGSLIGDFGQIHGAQLESYVDMIQRIAGYYAVPVLDLYRVSGLQPKVPVLQELYMPDGLHPNEAGHRRIADKLTAFLQQM